MTFRERLADWISGGALTRARDDVEWLDRKRKQWADRAIVRDDALRRIAAEEKPTSNATVRRMARIAREAIE
jgi:hypothetical protein